MGTIEFVEQEKTPLLKRVFNIIENYGILIQEDPLLFFLGADGTYTQETKTILVRDFGDLPSFLHELGHAIEDYRGVLSIKKRRTGEFVAHLFMYMMLFNEKNPENVLTDATSRYFMSTTEDRCAEVGDFEPLDVREAKKRACAAYNHPLAMEVRNLMNELRGEVKYV